MRHRKRAEWQGAHWEADNVEEVNMREHATHHSAEVEGSRQPWSACQAGGGLWGCWVRRSEHRGGRSDGEARSMKAGDRAGGAVRRRARAGREDGDWSSHRESGGRQKGKGSTATRAPTFHTDPNQRPGRASLPPRSFLLPHPGTRAVRLLPPPLAAVHAWLGRACR